MIIQNCKRKLSPIIEDEGSGFISIEAKECVRDAPLPFDVSVSDDGMMEEDRSD